MSEQTAMMIDGEIRSIITTGYDRAWELLSSHKKELEDVTQALMEYETITGAEVAALMRGEAMVRPSEDDDSGKTPSAPAVPTTGAAKPPREEPGTGGMEPQPST